MRTAIATAALGGLLIGAVLLTVGAASGPSSTVHVSVYRGYPDWLAGPLGGVPLPISSPSFAVLAVGMLACYVAALVVADAISARWALACIAGANVVFVLGPTLLHTDVFRYLAYARLGVAHGLNPYTSGPIAASSDPTFPLNAIGGYTAMPSPYGPLFTLTSYPLALLTMPAGFWVIKAAAGLSSLGCVGVVWACARRLGQKPVHAALFVGINPLLLIWGVGAAHNDLMLALLLAGGVYLMLTRRERLSAAVVALAAAVKAVGGLVLPFALLGTPRRAQAVVGAGVALVVLGAVSLVAFGSEGVRGYANAVSIQQDLNSGGSVPYQVSRALGAPPLPPDVVAYRMLPPSFYWVTSGVLLSALAYLLWRVWRGVDWLFCAAWAFLTLLITAAFLMPWYIVPVLPLAALARSPGVRYAVLAMTGYVIVAFTGQLS